MLPKNGFGVSLPFQLLCIPCDFAQSGISKLWIYGTFFIYHLLLFWAAAMVNNWLGSGGTIRWNLPIFPKFRGWRSKYLQTARLLGTGISRVFTYWKMVASYGKCMYYVNDTYIFPPTFFISHPPEPSKQNGTSSKLKLEWSHLPPRRCNFPPRHSIHARVRDWDQDQRKPLETKDHQRSPGVFFWKVFFFVPKMHQVFDKRELRWKDILCIS